MSASAKILNYGLILIFLPIVALGQTNNLKKKLSYQAESKNLQSVLSELEISGGFYFSYDAEILDPNMPISCHFTNERLESILQEILPQNIHYRAVGRHVVLYEDPDQRARELTLSGYVTDGRSNQPIIYASIYNPEHNILTASDASGYYELTLKDGQGGLTLVISRSGYQTSILKYADDTKDQVDVNLKLIEPSISGLEKKDPGLSSVNERGMVQVFVPDKLLSMSENDPIYGVEPYQISLIPGLSTNGLRNSNNVNHLSLNVLAGYSKATSGLEVGGLVNVDRSYVIGLQIAGLANVTGDSVKGAQVAGLSNYNGQDMTGIQMSGFSNVNWGDLHGLQISGFANTLNGHMYGSQMAGFVNFTNHSVDGFQISGFANVARKDVAISQLSGFANYATNNSGIQGAGFLNIITDSVNLGQIAGFANYAKYNGGLQLAAFFNYAHLSDGLQLAFINYADSSSSVPIGFFSYVRWGYNVLELSVDEYFPVNIGFKTGVDPFYNIFELGTNGEDIRANYGLGTLVNMGSKWQFNTDVIAGALFDINTIDQYEHRYLLRLEPSFCFKISPKFSIAAGPALRIYGAEMKDLEQETRFSDYYFYETTVDNWYFQSWLGGKFSLRFF